MANTKRKDKSRKVLCKGESQRPDGTYQFRWTDENRKRHCIYARNLDDLRYKEDEIDKDKKEIIAVCNFTNVERNNYRIGVPRSGTYKVILNSDSEEFGGGGKGTAEKVKSEKIPMHGFDNSIALDLAGMSVIYLTPPARRNTNKKSAKKSSK